jgi:hypothetical protein
MSTSSPSGVTPLKRVSAYRTSDGAIHETRAAAELREAEIQLREGIEHVLPMAESDEVHEQQLDALLEHVERLAPIFARLAKLRKRPLVLTLGQPVIRATGAGA